MASTHLESTGHTKPQAPVGRPPLTSTEKSTLKDLVERLTKTESQFCCGGTIEIPVDQKLSLFYGTDIGGSVDMESQGSQAGRLELSPAPAELGTIQRFLNACIPSAHGRGKETVFDETYRLARELRREDFALTMYILNESGVLTTIAALTSPRIRGNGLVARLYKLNAYGTGGFFKAHRDTPKSDRHVGTLVVALPIPFEGWRTDASGTSGQAVGLPWAFLFSDVEHEVLPVTSGIRVTLAYDIFASERTAAFAPMAMDGTSLPFYADLKAALNNKDFLSRGGKVAVALSHAYPINAHSASDAFASRLKGSDAALHRVLSALGLTMRLCAVYSTKVYDDELDFSVDHITDDDDNFGSIRLIEMSNDGSCKYMQGLYITDTFRFYDDDEETYWEESEATLFFLIFGARLEHDLIWARKPNRDAFSKSGYYIKYGNKAFLASPYVAAALIVKIPAVGEVPRVLT